MIRVRPGDHLPGLDPVDAGRVARWAAEIERRTGNYAWFEPRSGQVYFCVQDRPMHAPVAYRVRGLSYPGADTVCLQINRAKRPWRDKERAVEASIAADRSRRQSEAERVRQDRRPDSVDAMKHHINKAKHGPRSQRVFGVNP